MAKYTFKEFQAEYPNDAACLKRIMEIQYGGDVTGLPGLRQTDAVSSNGQASGLCLPVRAITSSPAADTISTRSRTKLTNGSSRCIS